MEKFFVSTDSTCDLYASEIASLKVGFVPLTYTVGSGENTQFVKDNFTEPQQYVDFFNLLRRGLPVKTAMLNFNDHYVYFLSLAEKGINNILHFTISYGLARTMEVGYEAVAEVKEKYPDFNVLIVESHTTTVGQGILVREACRMRDEGKTLEDTAEYVNRIKHNIQHFVMVDDLQHLKRGGRISSAVAAVGGVVKLKIILSFDRDGKLKVVNKIMGGTRKALTYIVSQLSNYTLLKDNAYPIVVHSDNLPLAQELHRQIVEASDGKVNPEIRVMGPVIGCHVGPNAVAFAFVSNELRPE